MIEIARELPRSRRPAARCAPLGTRSVLGSVPRTGQYNIAPTQISGLQLWLRPDLGGTIGATPLAFGSSPPVVGFTGTLTQSTGIYIEIDGAGTLGVATFKWGFFGAAGPFQQTGVLTAASVALGTTAINATFSAGSYLTSHSYVSTFASLADQSGSSNTASQVTAANQPALVRDPTVWNGRPIMRYDSSKSQYLKADGLGGMMAGTDLPYTIIAAVNSANAGVGRFFCGWGFTGAASPVVWFGYGVSNTLEIKKEDNGTTVSNPGLPVSTMDSAPHIVSAVVPGTTASLFIDGATTAVSGTSYTVGAISGDMFTVGALREGGGIGTFWNGDIAELAIWNRALTATERAAAERGMRLRLGTP